MKAPVLAASLFTFVITGAVSAADSAESMIKSKLAKVNPQFKVTSVQPAAESGLYEVELSTGEVVYSTKDGRYFIAGSLFETGDGSMTNLTAQKESAKRAVAIKNLKSSDMVVFQAKGKQKGLINVFTDIDCGYCRKLHQEVPKLNELGITVRYLAYPRAGVYADAGKQNLTASFKKIKSVWCDEDPTAAMTKAKSTGFIKDNLDCKAPIEEQFMLGQQIGVRGTPAIILENGEMLPGYMPADEIAKRLNI